MRTIEHNGCPAYMGVNGDRLVLGQEGFTLHKMRSNRRRSLNYEYVNDLAVDGATFHTMPRLRIISYRLSSVLLMFFETTEEAEEAKEAFTDAATR
jgi:hypothetical protein